MADKQVLLNAIDGVLAQVATAHAYYLSHSVDGLPVQAVYSSLTMVRLLVEESPDDDPTESEEDDTACKHADLEHQVLGGGNWVDVCHDCDSIVAQS